MIYDPQKLTMCSTEKHKVPMHANVVIMLNGPKTRALVIHLSSHNETLFDVQL